jgi:hypothetical protein
VADLADLPSELRTVGYRVPPRIRLNMTPVELLVRTQEVAALLAEAEDTGNDRLRIRANRLAKSMSPQGYRLALDTLGEEIRQARLNGEDQRAYALQLELERLSRENPQPDPERALDVLQEEVNRRVKMPPPTKSRLFNRMKGR